MVAQCQHEPCVCCHQQSKPPPEEQVWCKYIPPETREPYRPVYGYAPPIEKVEGASVYRKSYQPVAEKVETKPIRHSGTLTVGSGRFSDSTVTKLSYLPVERIPASVVTHSDHQLFGRGPFHTLTTHKLSYPPPRIERPQACRPQGNLIFPAGKANIQSTYRSSYLPTQAGNFPVPFIPKGEIKMPKGPMVTETETRASYRPVMNLATDRPKPTEYYKPSSAKMPDTTIYRSSYLPTGSFEKATSYQPENVYLAPKKPMNLKTIYRESYIPCHLEKTTPIHHNDNLHCNEGEACKESVYKLSYQNYESKPPGLLIYSDHKLIDDGPMDNLTIQRQDYTPKPLVKTEPSLSNKQTHINIKTDQKFVVDSVSRMTYVPPSQSESLRADIANPKDQLKLSSSRFDDTTIYKSSYLPNSPTQIRESCKPKQTYKKSRPAIDTNTVYSYSYKYPGKFVRCSKGDPDCRPCPPGYVPEVC